MYNLFTKKIVEDNLFFLNIERERERNNFFFYKKFIIRG